MRRKHTHVTTSHSTHNKSNEDDYDDDLNLFFTDDLQLYIPPAKYSPIAHRIGQPINAFQPHLLNKSELTVGISRKEYELRRLKLFTKLPKQSMLIIPCAPISRINTDSPYKYRQNSEFSYFTGLHEPYSLAIFTKNNNSCCNYVLFVRPRNIYQLTWNGHCCGVDAAQKYFGANESYEWFDQTIKINEYLKQFYHCLYFNSEVNPIITENVNKQLENYRRKQKNSKRFLEEIRLLKSNAEIILIRKSTEIAALSMIDTMKYCTVGMLENELAVHFEMGCKMRGAQRLSYMCAVASGKNGTILHYFNNDSILMDGDLVLIDCGAEYEGYSSDITRTFPVNGHFTHAQQELYEMVLAISDELIANIKPGFSITKLDKLVQKLLKIGMKKFGITRLLSDHQIKELHLSCHTVHYVAHFLGMDIHECNEITFDRIFEPGMCLAIEPAIYLPNSHFIPVQYRNIGIRIEDDVLITENGAQLLTHQLPRTVKEIELILVLLFVCLSVFNVFNVKQSEKRETWNRIQPFQMQDINAHKIIPIKDDEKVVCANKNKRCILPEKCLNIDLQSKKKRKLEKCNGKLFDSEKISKIISLKLQKKQKYVKSMHSPSSSTVTKSLPPLINMVTENIKKMSPVKSHPRITVDLTSPTKESEVSLMSNVMFGHKKPPNIHGINQQMNGALYHSSVNPFALENHFRNNSFQIPPQIMQQQQQSMPQFFYPYAAAYNAPQTQFTHQYWQQMHQSHQYSQLNPPKFSPLPSVVYNNGKSAEKHPHNIRNNEQMRINNQSMYPSMHQ